MPLLHNLHFVARIMVPAVVEHKECRIPKGFVRIDLKIEHSRANAIGLRNRLIYNRLHVEGIAAHRNIDIKDQTVFSDIKNRCPKQSTCFFVSSKE